MSDLAYNRAMVDIDAEGGAPAPDRPRCTHRSEEVGSRCNGRQVDGFDHCLAHLDPEQLDSALQRLGPDADLDASGTDINASLLGRILSAVASKDEPPTFGSVQFSHVHFIEDVSFATVRFGGDAEFTDAQFSGNAQFTDAQFSKDARFGGAQFGGVAAFGGTQFSGGAEFVHAEFHGAGWFGGAQFSRDAGFGGDARFGGAQFSEYAWFVDAEFCRAARFGRAQFSEDAGFDNAQFSGYAGFDDAQFSGYAGFDNAQFSGGAWFDNAQFSGGAGSTRAQFSKDARFGGAQFSKNAWFTSAQFTKDARFGGAQFSEDAEFGGARFEKATSLGPLAAGNLLLQRAVFQRPVVLEAAAVSVTCTDTTWEAGVTMRLRHATVDLERAAFTVPSFVAGADRPFALTVPGPTDLDESQILPRIPEGSRVPGDPWVPVLSSLRGADASNLSVTDVDLSRCRFAGARLLDQLRLEGRCIFDHPPERLHKGWKWPPVWWWSPRQSLAEERAWRVTTPRYSGWGPKAEKAEVGPERLAGLYRQLRKAQEDAKNEPGAADFYYGEMEMRRHSRTMPRAERAIIWLYWLVSGYGLRALRSLGALIMVGVVVTTALVGWGLAAAAPPQQLTGTATTQPHSPTRINGTIRTTTPQLPPASQRWTSERTGTAAEVTIESMVFRSTNRPLTTAGTWTTIAARILGPVLLFLALLAVRNRVKR